MATPFRELLIRLDMVLTGKPREEAERTSNHKDGRADDPVAFVCEMGEYYLSDGGYSRVWANEEGKVWLSSNSLQRAKDAWESPEAQALVGEIKAAIAEAVERAMGTPKP